MDDENHEGMGEGDRDRDIDIETLVRAHSRGFVTIRQIASLAGVSTEKAHEIVVEIYEKHDLGDDDPAPTTYTPDDFEDKDDE